MDLKIQGAAPVLGELVAIGKALKPNDKNRLIEIARLMHADAKQRGEVVEVPPSVVIDLPNVDIPDDRLDFLGLLATALSFLTDENVEALMLRLRELTNSQQGGVPDPYGAN